MAGVLDRVDFDHIEAERDPNLLNYFLETDSFLRIFKGNKMYVIGRKGTGKSTIYSAIEGIKDATISVVGLTFDDYPWTLHKRVKDETKSIDAAHTTTWRYIILIELAKLLIKEERASGKKSEELAKVAKFVKSAYGTPEPSFKILLTNALNRLRDVKKIELPRFDSMGLGGGQIEFEESKTNEQAILDTIRATTEAIQKVIPRLLSNRLYFILFDRLDDGWDNSVDFKSCMVGLLRATRDLNIEVSKQKKLLRCVVFLRSDIYDCLQYNDKNKAFPDIEALTWDQENLTQLINKRITASLSLSQSKARDAWFQVFERKVMRQRMPNLSYILRRTLLHPRDLIAFCHECKNIAVQNEQSRIMNRDIYDAEAKYSEYAYREFLDEMHKQHPFIDTLFEVLRRLGVERFDLHNFDQEFNASGLTQVDTRGALKILFDASVIGTYRIGGRAGGSTLEFKYTDPLIQPDFSREMIVHPALKKYLKLREKRARR